MASHIQVVAETMSTCPERRMVDLGRRARTLGGAWQGGVESRAVVTRASDAGAQRKRQGPTPTDISRPDRLAERPRHHERELLSPEVGAVRPDSLSHHDVRTRIAQRLRESGIRILRCWRSGACGCTVDLTQRDGTWQDGTMCRPGTQPEVWCRRASWML